MLTFHVYDETVEQAQAVAETLKSAFRKVPQFILVGSSLATPEIMRSKGISHYPAIMKNGVLLWEGSCPIEAQALQWIEESSAQRDEIDGAFGRFGYQQSNPIPADGNWYCRRLRCPSGHPYWYHRLGSSGDAPDGHIVDRVHLLCFGRESEIVLYFDMYHKGHSNLVPEGLSFETEPTGRGTTKGMVANFPEGI